MELHLDCDEQQLLVDILEQRYHELLWELARADKLAFKSGMREQLAVLEKVLEKARIIELTVK